MEKVGHRKYYSYSFFLYSIWLKSKMIVDIFKHCITKIINSVVS